MKLKARIINFETGGLPVIILNHHDAESLGLHSSDRVRIKYKGKDLIAVLDTTEKLAKPGEAAINDDVQRKLKLKIGILTGKDEALFGAKHILMEYGIPFDIITGMKNGYPLIIVPSSSYLDGADNKKIIKKR